MVATASQIQRLDLEKRDRGLLALYDALTMSTRVSTMPSTVATVGTTSVQLLAATERAYAILVNDSDAKVFLGFGEAAVYGSGVRLNANGGCFEVNWTNMWRGAINGISDGANKAVSLIEGRLI